MSLINSISTKYNYNYFDVSNQIQTKSLNIFQCFLRKVFGCYAETHLSNVVKKAYEVTLNGQFQGDHAKRQVLLKLIQKVECGYTYTQPCTMKLPDCYLSGANMEMSMRYNIQYPKMGGDDFEISSIDIGFHHPLAQNDPALRHSQQYYFLSISKNKSQQLIAKFPSPDLRTYNRDPKNLIPKKTIKNLFSQSRYLRAVSLMVEKILNDSATIPDTEGVRFHANDWRFEQGVYNGMIWRDKVVTDSKFSGPIQDPDMLNEAQDHGMGVLGWEYLTQLSVHQNHEKRVYFFKKEKVISKTAFNIKQLLSIDFATQSLKPLASEF